MVTVAAIESIVRLPGSVARIIHERGTDTPRLVDAALNGCRFRPKEATNPRLRPPEPGRGNPLWLPCSAAPTSPARAFLTNHLPASPSPGIENPGYQSEVLPDWPRLPPSSSHLFCHPDEGRISSPRRVLPADPAPRHAPTSMQFVRTPAPKGLRFRSAVTSVPRDPIHTQLLRCTLPTHMNIPEFVANRSATCHQANPAPAFCPARPGSRRFPTLQALLPIAHCLLPRKRVSRSIPPAQPRRIRQKTNAFPFSSYPLHSALGTNNPYSARDAPQLIPRTSSKVHPTWPDYGGKLHGCGQPGRRGGIRCASWSSKTKNAWRI
jgi:hypothetical protein